ncbi:hypothetical protein [Microbacterium sp. NPDC057650]|uniref:hypothetical protein n=1 Tax=unclassified Microbacterium TaxID=2609290 RepID=UPI003673218A
MWNWWTAKKASRIVQGVGSDSASERVSAGEVETEYSAYVSRIRKAIMRSVWIAVTGIAMIYLVAWLSQLSAEARSLNGDPAGGSFFLAPLPATMMLAGFSLLAAVAIGLQLAVRTPSTAESVPATAIARRRFLCEFARIIVVASFALAAYTAVPAVVAALDVFDLLRLFGPTICATLVALIAADAGVAADPDFAPVEISRVSRARYAALLLAGMRTVGRVGTDLPRKSIALQAVVLFAVPTALGLASSIAIDNATPWQRALLVVLAVVTAVVVYAVSVRLYLGVVTRDWTGVAFIICATAVFGVLGWSMIASAMLNRSSDARTLAPVAETLLWAVVYLAVPAFLAAWALASDRDERPRLLGILVGWTLTRRFRKRHEGIEQSNRPELNRLAAIAPWISPLVPFGLLLAIIAKQQIRRAERPPARAPQRGRSQANAAIILTVLFVVVFIAGLIVIAAMDLPEWNTFVWGN